MKNIFGATGHNLLMNKMFFFQKNVFPLSFLDGCITPTKITMSHPEMIVKCILSFVVFCM